jgi:hypothetical protein
MPRKTNKEIVEEAKRERRSRSRRYVPARSHVHLNDWVDKNPHKTEEGEEDSEVNANCRSP